MTVQDIVILIAFAIIALMVLLGPVVAAYLIYKFSSKKGKISKILGWTLLVAIIIGEGFIVMQLVFRESGFGPEYETVEIQQNIGGKLICSSIYTADIHSWIYSINYRYVTEIGDTLNIGGGEYIGNEWAKDEQLKKIGDWLILKTGLNRDTEKLVLRNTLTDSTLVYNFDESTITGDSLWQTKNIFIANKCCSEIVIQNIHEDKIILSFTYPADNSILWSYDFKTIEYKFNKLTGDIIMTKVE